MAIYLIHVDRFMKIHFDGYPLVNFHYSHVLGMDNPKG